MSETKKKTSEADAALKQTNAIESLYSVEEIIESGEQLFKQPKEVVTVALKNVNNKKITISEARNLVDKFLKKEVK